MTQEEKARRYDEALERAKGIYKETWNGYILKIFPELAELDDERTRKDIIHFVQSRLAGFPECERFIAWIEKQAPKPKWSEEDEIHENTIIRAIHGAGNITPIDGELAEKWLKSLKQRMEE